MFITIPIYSVQFYLIKYTGSYNQALFSVGLHSLVNPLFDVTYFGVHSVFHGTGTAVSPASGSFDEPLAVVLTDKWSATITLACVHSSLIQSCVQHGVVDQVGISLETPRSGNKAEFNQ